MSRSFSNSTFIVAVLFSVGVVPNIADAAQCLYVSSYHKGYEWNDGIEEGLDLTLAGKCRLEKFYMDTKRNQTEDFGVQKGLEAKTYIEKTKPDIVIACDDNASRYLVQPYFKDASTPFVFCGVNYTVQAYGYPYRNVTGMIEVAPVQPLMKAIVKIVDNPRRGVYLGADVHSQHKEYQYNQQLYQRSGIALDRRLVTDMDAWVAGYIDLQKYDFIILGSNGGLQGWDDARALDTVRQHTRTLTVTNMEWMVDYAMIAMTKVAKEQGEWAGQVALEILGGAKPAEIPIVANRKWNILVNPALVNLTDIKIPSYLWQKAAKVN